MVEHLLTTGRSWVRALVESNKQWYSLPSHLELDIREWSGKVQHADLPVDQPPPTSAFTAFTDMWSRAAEKEIGATLCAIGVGRTLKFFLEVFKNQ